MAQDAQPGLDLVDLTAPLSEGLWRYSDSFPRFESTPVADRETDGFTMHRLTLGTHLGTHSDAASHLIAGGWTMEELGLSPFVGMVTLLKLSAGSLEPIDAADLEVAAGGGIPRGDGVLLSTGWDKKFGSARYATDHPFLTEQAADWLVARGTRIVAADLPGLMDPRIDISPPADTEGTADGRLLRAEIPYVVGLTNVSTLGRDRVLLIALPLRIDGADGAPVRAVAVRDFGITPNLTS